MKLLTPARRHVLDALLFFLAAALLWFAVGARDAGSDPPLSEPHVIPQYLSIADFKEGIQRGDEHTEGLTHIYFPAWLPKNASVFSINVYETYVSLHWDGPDGLMFEWRRSENGQAYLEHQKETQELTLWTQSPYETWVSTTEHGRQYYWVQDGFRFSMYVPDHLAADDMSFEAVLYDLTE